MKNNCVILHNLYRHRSLFCTMLRKILIIVLLLAAFIQADGQADSSHLRISLLTCGPGDDEVWSVFGHTGVRVIDSVEKTDLVFNYGTFDFGPDFELQFMRGKLLYSLSIQTYPNFLSEYIQTKRRVEEQELLVDWKIKEHMYYFLQWNAEPGNKYYKYDFFFDNCATRIRDIFLRPEVFGSKFQYPHVAPVGKMITFRDIINQYFNKDHWTRTGVNILLGSKIDKVMTDMDIMFLPDYLRDGVAGGLYKGQKIAAPSKMVLTGINDNSIGIDGPLVLTCILALLTILGLTVPKLRILGKVMSILILLATGLLGCLILVMWFATDHQGCSDNFNLLWCLPLNVYVAFFNPKGKGKYGLIGIFFILLSVVFGLLKTQGLVIEFVPVFIALCFIYFTMYRKSLTNNKTITANA